jgi:CRISPR-associated RAMP protein (TIGR02581 family)
MSDAFTFDRFENRLEVSGILSTITALRVGAGKSTDPTSSDVPVIKDALGRPLIPGSSFKGAMRSHLESFMRGIHDDLANDPSELVNRKWKDLVKNLKDIASKEMLSNDKKVSANADARLTQNLIKETDRVSLLFGSPWIAGKLQIQDLHVLPDIWFGQYQERDGVSIERDTETAADGRKYDFQVVPAGTQFSFKAIVENASPAELGLLMIGLTQFENEMIPLGGGTSRGLGVVKLELDGLIWVNPSNSQELLDYLQKLVTGQIREGYDKSNEIASLKNEWVLALINELNPPVPIATT